MWSEDDVSARIYIWRAPCTDTDAVVLLTFEPIEGRFLVCNSQFKVEQDDREFTNLVLRRDPESSDTFCGRINERTTFAVDQSGGEVWDDDERFTLVYTGFGSEKNLGVGHYDSTNYPGLGDDLPLELKGSLSGSWYDRDRSGEGFLIEVAKNADGHMLVLYWFTHLEGEPYWLLGVAGFNPGKREITVPLYEYSGTGFGSNFNPEEITEAPWGEITMRFDSCSTGVAEWNSDVGLGSGSFTLERITLRIAGYVCNE